VDNLTHTLFGLTLARTALARAGPGTTAALVIASNAPDIDIVTTAGGALGYLRWHRGPTHGPIGLIGLALATAAAVYAVQRRQPAPGDTGREEPPRPSFLMLAAVSLIGVAMHVLMDLPTSYGTRWFSPFDWHWYAVDWMPIIDIYLLIALAAGLVFGRASARAARVNALMVLMLMAANYGVRAIAHHQALVVAPRLFGPALPPPCLPEQQGVSIVDRWPRAAPVSPAPDGHRCLIEVAAMPTRSPFRWRVLAQMSNAYEVRDVDLFDSRLRDPALELSWRVRVRFPNVWTPAVLRAATTGLAQAFLGFSRFPAARWVVDGNGVTTVRIEDMRFAGVSVAIDQPLRAPNIFTAIVRLDASGRVVEQRLGR
jgi:membrane-bound metal-dependent hydrolase YbcI (DUF457 family)